MTISAFYVILVCLTSGISPKAVLDNDVLLERIKALEVEMESVKADDKSKKHEIREMKKEMEKLERSNAHLREAVEAWTDDKQMTVDSMFLATISTSSVSVSPGEPIIWDSAPINPGGHFNTILGMYEVPVDGYYQFSVNKEWNNYYGSFWLLVDETRYLRKDLYLGDANETPSGFATINIELTTGQIVRVENEGSSEIFGTNADGTMHSWFTGNLLYAL